MLKLIICFHARVQGTGNYRMLWHPIMNHQNVLKWRWEHRVLGVFYFNEQSLRYVCSPFVSSSAVELFSLQLAERDAWSAFSGLSLKLFLVFWKWTLVVMLVRAHSGQAYAIMCTAGCQLCLWFIEDMLTGLFFKRSWVVYSFFQTINSKHLSWINAFI